MPVSTRLLASGAETDTADSYGRTPLSLVARESVDVELAQMLIDRKATKRTVARTAQCSRDPLYLISSGFSVTRPVGALTLPKAALMRDERISTSGV